ncbi:hypothetical protein [Actinoplanes sp. NPDC026670]|uniref:hypothetical protein n=1 Tax=Actinoplanes sp. NPDC026670 TaxID=3154700 RepID=UPI0033D3FE33
MLEPVDAAIGAGIIDSTTPNSSAYHHRRGLWHGYVLDNDGRQRPDPQLVQRPYTREEAVLLLLDAMLAVYRDLPDMATDTIRELADGRDGRALPVDSIMSADGNGPDDAVNLWVTETGSDRENRLRVISALLALREAVLA